MDPCRSMITLLPKDVIMNIVARVAAHSHVDVFNMELVCKSFSGVTNDEKILNCVSIWRIISSWSRREEKRVFLNRCIEAGNPMALYVQGVDNYFNRRLQPLGIEFLQRASDNGCMEAAYVLGIIFLCRHDELKTTGMELIERVRNSNCLMQCRTSMINLKTLIWIYRVAGWKRGVKICTIPGHVLKYRVGWDAQEFELEEDPKCDACVCDCEIEFFLKRILNIM